MGVRDHPAGRDWTRGRGDDIRAGGGVDGSMLRPGGHNERLNKKKLIMIKQVDGLRSASASMEHYLYIYNRTNSDPGDDGSILLVSLTISLSD